MREGQRLPGSLQIIGERIKAMHREAAELQAILTEREASRPTAPVAPVAPGAGTDTGTGVESKAAEQARKRAENEAAARAKAVAQIKLEAEQQARLVAAKAMGEDVYADTLRSIELENAAREAGIDLASDEGQAFQSAFRQREQFASQLERIGEVGSDAFEGLQSDVASLEGSMSDAFASMVVSGEMSFKRLGDAFLQQFVSRIAQGLIFAPIFSALGGLPGIFGQAFGGARAAGGSVVPGKAYLVGEKGPELIVPSTSGVVMPSRSLTTPRFSAAAARASAAPLTVNIVNEHSGAEVSASEGIGPDGKKQLQILVAEATDANLRAGRHDRALRARFQGRPRGGVA